MSKLPFHEWLIICLFIIILLMLGFITLVWKNDKMPQVAATHELSAQIIQVSVKGKVNKPGTYDFKKGALLKDLLELAQPLPEADLSRMKLDAKLRDGQQVAVPAQNWITVFVEGAGVQPQQLRVKLGTLLNELPELVTFLPEADTGKLQRKRRLKDQEVINVSLKKPNSPKKKGATKKRAQT